MIEGEIGIQSMYLHEPNIPLLCLTHINTELKLILILFRRRIRE